MPKKLQVISATDISFDEKVFSALQEQGGFILDVNDELSETIGATFKAYIDLLFNGQVDQYKGKKDGLHGFYDSTNYHYGTYANRFFISRNEQGQALSALPPDLEEATSKLALLLQALSKRVLRAIALGLSLEEDEITELLCQSSLIAMSSYAPPTQESLKRSFEEQNLIKTEDGRYNIFFPHKDLSILSFLMYLDNIARGLEVEIDGEFQALELDLEKGKCQIVVMGGLMLEMLANENLKALSHRVVGEPLEKGGKYTRTNAAYFASHNPDMTLAPFHAKEGGENFMTVFLRKKEEYDETAYKMAVKKLDDCDFSQFPTKDELVCKQEESGLTYYRA